MFSFNPYTDSQFYPQSAYSYRRPHTSNYVPAAYARAAAAERERERIATARRLAAEQEARARRARMGYGYGYQDDDDEPYGYGFGLGPRERAYLQAKREQEAMERARIMEARKAREAELRAQRERERRAAIENFYHGLGLRTPEEEQDQEEVVSVSDAINDGMALTNIAQAEQSESDIQISAKSSRSPSPTSRASPEPTSPTPEERDTTPIPTTSTRTPTPEEREEAATKIQTLYRTHRALSRISSLQSKFESLKKDFILPSSIDYSTTDGAIITLKSDSTSPSSDSDEGTESYQGAKLAFTHTNIPIRAYDEELNRILTKLDGVESWGIKKVREKRKAVVRAVEEAAGRLEVAWREVWRMYVEGGKEEKMEEDEVEAVVLNEETMEEDGVVEESSASEPSAVESVAEPTPLEPEAPLMNTTVDHSDSGVSSSTPTQSTIPEVVESSPSPTSPLESEAPLASSTSEASPVKPTESVAESTLLEPEAPPMDTSFDHPVEDVSSSTPTPTPAPVAIPEVFESSSPGATLSLESEAPLASSLVDISVDHPDSSASSGPTPTPTTYTDESAEAGAHTDAAATSDSNSQSQPLPSDEGIPAAPTTMGFSEDSAETLDPTTDSDQSDMESNDSDYQSVGSISELEAGDESEDGSQRDSEDFVML